MSDQIEGKEVPQQPNNAGQFKKQHQPQYQQHQHQGQGQGQAANQVPQGKYYKYPPQAGYYQPMMPMQPMYYYDMSQGGYVPQQVPVVKPAVKKPEVKPEENDAKKAFLEAIKKKAAEKKAKAEAEEKAKVEAEAEAKAKAEQEKADAEAKAKAEADAKVKAEADAQAQAKLEAEEKAKADAEAAAAAVVVAAAAKVQVDAEEAKEEAKQESVDEAKEQPAEATISEPNASSAVPAPVEGETEPETEAAPVIEGPTLSEFLALLKIAKPVEDVYSFKYHESAILPSPRLQTRTKKCYDPNFLSQFAEPCLFHVDDEWKAQHPGLLAIIQSKEAARSNSKGSRVGSNKGGAIRQGTIRGEYERNSRTGSKRRQASRRSGREPSRRDKPRREEKKPDGKPVIKLAPEEVKPLEKSASRWVPKSQKKVEKPVAYAPDGVTVIYDDDDIQKKTKSLLNKMTLDNLDVIGNELLTLASQSQWEEDKNALNRVIENTFAKAFDEPHWSAMYAQWTNKLLREIDPEVGITISNTQGEEQTIKGSNLVYRIIMKTCQVEYEKGWSNNLPTNEDGSPLEPEMMSDEYYEIAKAKRRGLGLVRFIAELYKLNILKENILISCLKKLMTSEDGTDDEYVPQEDTLETILQLLLTAGPRLSKSQPSVAANVFNIIEGYTQNEKVGARLRFKLMDLLDSYKANWNDGKAGEFDGPKTIKEIHAAVDQKREQEKRDHSKRGDRGGRNDSRQGSRWGTSDVGKIGQIRSNAGELGPRKGSSNSLANARRGVTDDGFTAVSTRSKSVRSQSQQQQQQQQQQPSTPTQPAGGDEDESRQNSKNIFSQLMDEEEHEEHHVEEEQQQQEEEETQEQEEHVQGEEVEVEVEEES